MQYTGFIKRFLPFAMTFAAGLLIASFFVPIGFGRLRRGHDDKHRNDYFELKMRFEKSEEENMRLRNQLDDMKINGSNDARPQLMEVPDEADLTVPPPPMVPIAPVAPHRHR